MISLLDVSADFIAALPINTMDLGKVATTDLDKRVMQAMATAIFVNRQANLIIEGGATQITLLIRPEMRERIFPSDAFNPFASVEPDVEPQSNVGEWSHVGTLNGYMLWASPSVPDSAVVVLGDDTGVVLKLDNAVAL
jgi:hypothetical protein